MSLTGLLIAVYGFSHDTTSAESSRSATNEVSFKYQIMPIVQRECLPCHAADNFNPSELSLDSRELLLSGGRHGASVVPGKSGESVLFQKLGQNPPFGDRMPLDPKKKRGERSTRSLSHEEINLIGRWIDQGVKNN